jgi:hypothetical protein
MNTQPVLRIVAPFGAAFLVRTDFRYPAANRATINVARLGGTLDQMPWETIR